MLPVCRASLTDLGGSPTTKIFNIYLAMGTIHIFQNSFWFIYYFHIAIHKTTLINLGYSHKSKENNNQNKPKLLLHILMSNYVPNVNCWLSKMWSAKARLYFKEAQKLFFFFIFYEAVLYNHTHINVNLSHKTDLTRPLIITTYDININITSTFFSYFLVYTF